MCSILFSGSRNGIPSLMIWMSTSTWSKKSYANLMTPLTRLNCASRKTVREKHFLFKVSSFLRLFYVRERFFGRFFVNFVMFVVRFVDQHWRVLRRGGARQRGRVCRSEARRVRKKEKNHFSSSYCPKSQEIIRISVSILTIFNFFNFVLAPGWRSSSRTELKNRRVSSKIPRALRSSWRRSSARTSTLSDNDFDFFQVWCIKQKVRVFAAN